MKEIPNMPDRDIGFGPVPRNDGPAEPSEKPDVVEDGVVLPPSETMRPSRNEAYTAVNAIAQVVLNGVTAASRRALRAYRQGPGERYVQKIEEDRLLRQIRIEAVKHTRWGLKLYVWREMRFAHGIGFSLPPQERQSRHQQSLQRYRHASPPQNSDT